MTGWNLPDGCEDWMLPGNSREEAAWEKAFEKWVDCGDAYTAYMENLEEANYQCLCGNGRPSQLHVYQCDKALAWIDQYAQDNPEAISDPNEYDEDGEDEKRWMRRDGLL